MTNITPAKIVEMYLPEYEKRAAEWRFQYSHSITNLTKQDWIDRVFPEALAERDRILCQRQREICGQIYDDLQFNGTYRPSQIIDKIENAPIPELKE